MENGFVQKSAKLKKGEENSAFAYVKPLAENTDPSNADLMKAILFMSNKFDKMSKENRVLSDNNKELFRKFEKTGEKLKIIEDSSSSSTLKNEVKVLKQDKLVFKGRPV